MKANRRLVSIVFAAGLLAGCLDAEAPRLPTPPDEKEDSTGAKTGFDRGLDASGEWRMG